MGRLDNLRTAIVHHWFVTRTGGERVCEALAPLLGTPDLYALVADSEALGPALRECRLQTSGLASWPAGRTHFRHYAPLFPHFVRQFDLRGYDLVVTSDAFLMKGIQRPARGLHVCYCHTPMRHIWPCEQDPARVAGPFPRAVFTLLRPWLRRFDRSAARNVDHFLANSPAVEKRIAACYGREAEVIPPPVAIDRFTPTRERNGAYLFVGRLVPYKRADLAVAACSRLGRRLIVVGEGPERARLERLAGPGIAFRGWVEEAELADLYAQCTALLCPGLEDFGLVMVEAQAAGRPVLALGQGGGACIVEPGKTGLHLAAPSVPALERAILDFERDAEAFAPEALRAGAERFSVDRFQTRMQAVLAHELSARGMLG